MTALTKARNTRMRSGEVSGHPVKAAIVCHQGGLAVLDGGYAGPGRAATTLVAIGRFEETVDNSAGAAGDKQVRVSEGTFHFANSSAGDLIAQADAGADCYIVDDQTVAKTNGSSTRSRAGKIEAVDADGVWVRMGLGV
ncbi:hypothetical protein [Denitromonas halophila]|uniref:DUF2190 family protein n=1 Tax=Denitromonas halophila TaxID=1629404 RepID=A0A557QX95_9RHOO|nr:hypothetical protein [Denitromonas halophila]TVO57535.1 hypothetical protein FHP91_07615 [Denitromonas halophila]